MLKIHLLDAAKRTDYKFLVLSTIWRIDVVDDYACIVLHDRTVYRVSMPELYRITDLLSEAKAA